MSTPKTFEDLDAWMAARDLTNADRRPEGRRIGGTGSARSGYACGLIFQFGRRRGHPSTFHASSKVSDPKRMNNIARRSCGEVRSMSYVLLDNQFINTSTHTVLREPCVRSGQLISGLIRSLQQR